MAPRKPPERRQNRVTSEQVVHLEPIRGGIPSPNEAWMAETQAEWVEFWGSESSELVKPAHRATLVRLFEWRDRQHAAWGRAERFRAEAAKEPFIEGSTGQPKLNPLFAQAEKADAEALQIETRIVALEDRFGLSSKAEIGLGVDFQRRQNLEALNLRMWEAMGGSSEPDPRDPRALPGDTATGTA